MSNNTNNSKKEYCNKFTINRAKHKSGYTVISNQLIRDKRLTVIEKGIMVMILSNDSTKYVLNMKILKPELGIGDDKFNNSIKNLTELGYINKLKFQGGIHWIINEIPAPIKGLRNSAKCVSTPSENTPCENTSCENTPSGNTSCENPSLIINNSLGKSAEALSPLAEEIPIERITNKRGNGVKTDFGVNDLVNDNSNTSNTSDNIPSNSTSTIDTNDLELILQNSQKFKMVYDNARWSDLNISTYSNIFIAYAVKCKLEGNPIDSITNSRIYNMITFLTKYSSTVEGSELWSRFQIECNDCDYLIKKLID